MSEVLRQYLAVLVIGGVAAGSTLGLLALGRVIRPRRFAPGPSGRASVAPSADRKR